MSDFTKNDIDDLKKFMASLSQDTKEAVVKLDNKMDNIQNQLKEAFSAEIKAQVNPLIEKQEQLFKMFDKLASRVTSLEVPDNEDAMSDSSGVKVQVSKKSRGASGGSAPSGASASALPPRSALRARSAGGGPRAPPLWHSQ